jgi:hypothetical protein
MHPLPIPGITDTPSIELGEGAVDANCDNRIPKKGWGLSLDVRVLLCRLLISVVRVIEPETFSPCTSLLPSLGGTGKIARLLDLVIFSRTEISGLQHADECEQMFE